MDVFSLTKEELEETLEQTKDVVLSDLVNNGFIDLYDAEKYTTNTIIDVTVHTVPTVDDIPTHTDDFTDGPVYTGPTVSG